MKIAVGSKNEAKVKAVAEILRDYPHLADASVEGYDVSSDISAQPLTLEETVRGARNRAKKAFEQGADYGIGIESGLIEVPYSKSGYMDMTCAAIYDGTEFHLGLTSGWEFRDPEIFKAISSGEGEMTEVLLARGIFKDDSDRAGNGAIHFATNGRLDRATYTKEAIRMALIHIDQ